MGFILKVTLHSVCVLCFARHSGTVGHTAYTNGQIALGVMRSATVQSVKPSKALWKPRKNSVIPYYCTWKYVAFRHFLSPHNKYHVAQPRQQQFRLWSWRSCYRVIHQQCALPCTRLTDTEPLGRWHHDALQKKLNQIEFFLDRVKLQRFCGAPHGVGSLIKMNEKDSYRVSLSEGSLSVIAVSCKKKK